MRRVTGARAISSAFGFRLMPRLLPGWSASLSPHYSAPICAARRFGIVLGNLLGYAILGVLATFGPRYGVPQMLASRLAFGKRGKRRARDALSFLAGVGWFTINTIFGAYALQTIAHISLRHLLSIMLLLQIVLAVYGYNLIGVFERVSAVLLAAGFVLLGAVTLPQASWVPATHRSPASCLRQRSHLHTRWAGCHARRIILAIFQQDESPRGVLVRVRRVRAAVHRARDSRGGGGDRVARQPAHRRCRPKRYRSSSARASWQNSCSLTVVLGTLAANCMNLYSGALAALVAFDVRVKRAIAALVVGISVRCSRSAVRTRAHRRVLHQLLAVALVLDRALGRGRARRSNGSRAGSGAIRTRVPPGEPARSHGFSAWLASIPFWNQAWFTGVFAHAYPQYGDLSYYVGILICRGAAMAALRRFVPQT